MALSQNANAGNFFKVKDAFNLNWLPAPYDNWEARTTDPAARSSHNTGTFASPCSFMLNALIQMAKGDKIGVIRLGACDYVAEYALDNGTVMIAHATNRPILEACIWNPASGSVTAVSGITTRAEIDLTVLMAVYFCIMADLNDQLNAQNCTNNEELSAILSGAVADGVLNEQRARKACDDLYYALNFKGESWCIPVALSQGNCNLLTAETITSLAFSSGRLVYGTAPTLKPQQVVDEVSITVKEAMEDPMVVEYVRQLKWTPEEEMLIPSFPDYFPVPTEAWKFISRFLVSRKQKVPMVNFGWRGITAYGKSTGVEVMACILHTPLLRQTCHTGMERSDFLCEFVPNSSGPEVKELPDLGLILNAPDMAYEKLAGESKADATSDEVFALYTKAVAEKAAVESGKSHFKMVEAPFIRALEHGYICEIQEFSRIRDSGVLVGLNEFDRPGSVIPRVDGTFVRRHKNAICMWTDNVGYTSCRPVDPSVVRRFAFIIDSYTMSKDKVVTRVKYNTGAGDKLIDKLYELWVAIADYCKKHDIDEGPVDMTGLERAVLLAQYERGTTLKSIVRDCIVAKAASDPDIQQEVMDQCVTPKLSELANRN